MNRASRFHGVVGALVVLALYQGFHLLRDTFPVELRIEAGKSLPFPLEHLDGSPERIVDAALLVCTPGCRTCGRIAETGAVSPWLQPQARMLVLGKRQSVREWASAHDLDLDDILVLPDRFLTPAMGRRRVVGIPGTPLEVSIDSVGLVRAVVLVGLGPAPSVGPVQAWLRGDSAR